MTATTLRVLVIAGSSRAGAFSAQLAATAAAALRAAGAEPTRLDLRALAMPIYDGDLEAAQGQPDGARALRAALAAHDAMLLVTPEYNGFPTPLTVNAFDWLSRLPAEGDLSSGLATTAGKPVALLSTSPGPLGGLRSLNFMRQFFSMAFQMLVVPQQYALARANEAFDDNGALKDPKAGAAVDAVVRSLLRVAAALRGARTA